MAFEIERKFLIDLDKLGDLPQGKRIVQGYIPTENFTVVRVRISGNNAWLTLKSKNKGIKRHEFEYPIPLNDAEEIFQSMCGKKIIEKIRYEMEFEGHIWEVDIFSGDNEGLAVAEVELESENTEPGTPPWVTTEVTGKSEYYNSNLIDNPYSTWDKTSL